MKKETKKKAKDILWVISVVTLGGILVGTLFMLPIFWYWATI